MISTSAVWTGDYMLGSRCRQAARARFGAGGICVRFPAKCKGILRRDADFSRLQFASRKIQCVRSPR